MTLTHNFKKIIYFFVSFLFWKSKCVPIIPLALALKVPPVAQTLPAHGSRLQRTEGEKSRIANAHNFPRKIITFTPT